MLYPTIKHVPALDSLVKDPGNPCHPESFYFCFVCILSGVWRTRSTELCMYTWRVNLCRSSFPKHSLKFTIVSFPPDRAANKNPDTVQHSQDSSKRPNPNGIMSSILSRKKVARSDGTSKKNHRQTITQQWDLQNFWWWNTVDGRNPGPPKGCFQNLVHNGKNYLFLNWSYNRISKNHQQYDDHSLTDSSFGPKDPNAMHPTISRLRKWLAAVNVEGVLGKKCPMSSCPFWYPKKITIRYPTKREKSENHSTPHISWKKRILLVSSQEG